VTVLDRSNPGEGLTRVEFAVGPTGIGRRTEEKAALLSASRAAGTGVEELAGEIERLQSEVERLEGELAELREQALASRIDDLEPVERNGYTLAAGAVESVDANGAEDALRAAAGDVADAVVAVGTSGSTFVAVAAGEGADAGDVVAEVTDEFGGGGGGSPRFAQGGGIGADPEAVVAFLRGEA
jgi:alanyl-tRNA synthetase